MLAGAPELPSGWDFAAGNAVGAVRHAMASLAGGGGCRPSVKSPQAGHAMHRPLFCQARPLTGARVPRTAVLPPAMRSVQPPLSQSFRTPPKALGNRRARVDFREILTIPQRVVAGKPEESRGGPSFIRIPGARKVAPPLAFMICVAHSGLSRTVPDDWHELKHLANGSQGTMTNIAPRLCRDPFPGGTNP